MPLKDSTYQINKIIDRLNLNHLKQNICDDIKNVCTQYHDIFLKTDEPLTFSSQIKHSIRTTTDNPIYTKNYRYPYVHREEVNNQINKLLKQRIIKPSISPIVVQKMTIVEFKSSTL